MWGTSPARFLLPGVVSIAAVSFLVVLAINVSPKPEKKVLYRNRNFYGTVKILKEGAEGTETEGRGLYHGRIMHGYQYTSDDRREEPCSYYAHNSGIDLAVQHFPREWISQFRIAVVGLGSGSMAAHARRGDLMRFYEIDPQVVELSDEWFTYRKDAIARGAKVEVVLGDARVSLEREDVQDYDLIVLDAFSGDAIPVHLLTHEAVELYLRHLRPGGIIAVHISNRYLRLERVLHGIADRFELRALLVEHSDVDGGPGGADSDWILLTKNQEFLNNAVVESIAQPEGEWETDKAVIWTDQRSDLYGVMK
jgi:SAM-dependent methyltransferase